MALSEAGADLYRPRRNAGTDAKPRWIRAPKDELKHIQRRILRSVLSDIPAHHAAYAAKGRGGTVGAASEHLGRDHLLYLDLSNFFPSVSPRQVFERLVEIGVQEGTASILTGLVTVDDQLPQGAPTSPAVADLVLYPMDARIDGLARQEGWSFTRYVDDIAVSGSQTIGTFGRRQITKIVESEGWALNDKGDVFGPQERKRILGLTVGACLSVPAEYRNRVRSTLRLVASGKKELTPAEVKSLRGKIAWIFAIHPHQGRRLRLMLDDVVSD